MTTWSAILTEHAGRAYLAALRATGDRSLAEDAVQEACVRLLGAEFSATDPGKVRNYLLRAVHSAAVDLVRSSAARRRREEAARMEKPTITPGPEEVLVDAELAGAAREALSGLPPELRTAVSLCCEQGLSHREAGEVLGLPKDTVTDRVRRGLERLQKVLAAAGHAGCAPAALAAGLGSLGIPSAPAGLLAKVQALAEGAKTSAVAPGSAATAMQGGLIVKIAAGVLLAGTLAGGATLALQKQEAPSPAPAAVEAAVAAEPAEKPADAPAGDVPMMVMDESAPRWVVDRFAGNSTAGPQFFQGPAREVGGLGRPFVAPAPDGTVFLGLDDTICKVTPKGLLRLLAGGGSNLGDCAAREAAIKVESICYSPADQSVYFLHRTIPCVRRLFQKDGEWRVEIAAGSPTDIGLADGAGGAAGPARFKAPRSLAVASDGRVYVLDVGNILRLIEKGQVSTIQTFKGGPTPVDGPLDQATLGLTEMSGMICLGDDDDTLYVADHWHFCARKIDLKAKTVTTVVGMPKVPKDSPLGKRYNNSADGPALTHASFNSGCAFVMWDPVHKALWVDGPDAVRLRWLRDGWLRTVFAQDRGQSEKWPKENIGVPGDKVGVAWAHIRAVDAQGRAYLMTGSCKTGIWRAYEKGGGQ